MTQFQGADNAPSTAPPKEPEKPVEPKPVVPASRVLSNPELWSEALELAQMLKYCRPHLSKTERKFIAKYLVPLDVKFDKKGNIYKKISDNPEILWSCHTDTVHSTHGIQNIVYWPAKNTGDIYFSVDQPKTGKKSSCLGADDTCGVWLMLQLIKAQKPGLYIFHRGEECGGIGSKWISEHNKDALKGIRFAIAFDRRGEKSIITHQRSTRCCSDEFAKSLAEQLNMGHSCDTGGSFTDTASYVGLIPECTNVSVGYDGAHSQAEDTNVDYLFRLRDALLKADFSKLVEKRKPGENERLYSGWGGSPSYYEGGWFESAGRSVTVYRNGHVGKTGMELRKEYKNKSNKLGWLDDYDFDQAKALWFPSDKKKKDSEGQAYGSVTKTVVTYPEMIRLIRLNPEIVADILESVGFTPSTLREDIFSYANTGQVIHL